MQTINNATLAIKEIWSYQNPVIHIWFLFSVMALCSMFAFMVFVF